MPVCRKGNKVMSELASEVSLHTSSLSINPDSKKTHENETMRLLSHKKRFTRSTLEVPQSDSQRMTPIKENHSMLPPIKLDKNAYSSNTNTTRSTLNDRQPVVVKHDQRNTEFGKLIFTMIVDLIQIKLVATNLVVKN